MKRILCAIDDSPLAKKAVDYAIDLARQLQSELTFIHVVRPGPDEICHTYFWDSSVLKKAEQTLQLELQEAMMRAHQRELHPVFCTTVPGDNIPQAILGYARRNAHDLLVTGAAAGNDESRTMLGSIASQIIQSAHCPVTVVR
jgi:universal stress protein A